MNVATLEERRCRAKDEIYVACDITVLKILATTIEQDSVLPTQKAAIAKCYAITVYAQRQSLSNWPGRILKSDVFCRKTIAVNLH